MRRVELAFGGVLVLGAALLAVTLSHSPIAVARVNGYQHVLLGTATQKTAVCQSDELLPRNTSAVRLQMFAGTGPRVTVAVIAHGRVIAHGERGSGWTGGSVTVPVNRVGTAQSGVMLCFALFLNGDEQVSLGGEQTSTALAAHAGGEALPGRIRAEYLRPGGSSWWSLALPVARRMGLGRAWSGTWIALFVVGLMAAVALLSSRVVLRELR